MTGRSSTERILDAYLAPEEDRLPDRVIDAALADIDRTPQRRALRVPWRFPTMPALTRATGIAAVALVAVVGAGGLLYLNSKAPGGPGGQPTATPALTPAPTPNTPGITGFTSYTSTVYGFTLGYPDGWSLASPAMHKWQPGDQDDDGAYDIFVNPEGRDGDGIALLAWQQPAGSGADITSREGLAGWVQANRCDGEVTDCETVPERALPMCLGKVACLPAILVSLSGFPSAYFADPETGLVTVVSLGRKDDFPAAARYGGGVQLLKSIMTTMDVWTPEPGQIPG